MGAAIAALRRSAPARIVAAVPVGSVSTCAQVREQTGELVCLQTPDPFFSVGTWYENFDQVGDGEVRRLLNAAAARGGRPPG
jgi:putative phosphoribosyl transferase